jgi:hypothetical protein
MKSILFDVESVLFGLESVLFGLESVLIKVEMVYLTWGIIMLTNYLTQKILRVYSNIRTPSKSNSVTEQAILYDICVAFTLRSVLLGFLGNIVNLSNEDQNATWRF